MIQPAGIDPKVWTLIKRLAGMYCRKACSQRELDDLVQEGIIAAWRASEKWDGKTGTLVGWCSVRVRGAMQDYLRTYVDPLSREQRKLVSAGLILGPRHVEIKPQHAVYTPEYGR